MRTHSLAARLMVVQQITTTVVIAVFAGSSLWLTAHVLRQQQDAFLADTADRLARAFEDELREQSDPNLAASAVIEALGGRGVHIDILDAAGHRLAGSRSASGPSASRAAARDPGPPRVATARATGGVVIRAS